ncbi:MAG: AAA family ATPase [Endomicrobiaceae bacterium]
MIKYWAVGASLGGTTDKTEEFLKSGTWQDGYGVNGDPKYKLILEKVSIGDILIMKSSSTKGSGHSISFTKLKGIGKVIAIDDYYSFKMQWFNIEELPRDFDNISYRETIEEMREDKILEFVKQKIAVIGKVVLRKKIIDLLKYKKQIILQGPPGTGKTREAKLIAEELTKKKKIAKASDIINSFVKNFDLNSEKIKEARIRRENLLKEFYNLFPKEKLNELSLQSYCIGKGDNSNFCWWIERGLKPLGYYSPGNARSYQIFWKNELADYSKHGFIKNTENNEEAMKKVAELINEVVKTKNTDIAITYFGNSFLLKLLNSYYPEEYFPINSEPMINNALSICNLNSQGNIFEKNKMLNEFYIKKKEEFNSKIDSFEFAEELFNNFNLKTGESINQENEIEATGDYKIIQFHPAYSYEDFVRGIVAITEDKSVNYRVENKILADFAKKAKEDPNGNYVLIIDEINRANLPAVLGELIYGLEYRNEAIESMYEYMGEREIILPNNLFIIGTMNTADRSVGHIDYAIRRRFAFVDMSPDENVISNPKAKNLFFEIKKLFTDEYLSPDFKAKDVMIGHSYFIVKDENELKLKLEFEIKPILEEYLKDGIFLDIASEKIESLNV